MELRIQLSSSEAGGDEIFLLSLWLPPNSRCSPFEGCRLQLLPSTSAGKRERLSQSVATIHTTQTMLQYLHAKLSGTVWIVPSSPHTVIMISVAVGNVQLSADLLVWTVYLQREQYSEVVKLFIITPQLRVATFEFLAVLTSQRGMLSWWMTTFTCWLRAKATMASLPAKVPAWDRLDTENLKKKKRSA